MYCTGLLQPDFVDDLVPNFCCLHSADSSTQHFILQLLGSVELACRFTPRCRAFAARSIKCTAEGQRASGLRRGSDYPARANINKGASLLLRPARQPDVAPAKAVDLQRYTSNELLGANPGRALAEQRVLRKGRLL